MFELFPSDQELQRRDELKRLKELGINPYPSETFDVNSTTVAIKEGFTEGSEGWEEISLAGRITSKRDMGKASFAELQDAHGKIQLNFQRDELCPGEDKTLYNQVYKKLTSLGDIIGVKGFIFLTQTGEITLHVKEFTILSKIIKPKI